jgi:hypothetical protein
VIVDDVARTRGSVPTDIRSAELDEQSHLSSYLDVFFGVGFTFLVTAMWNRLATSIAPSATPR